MGTDKFGEPMLPNAPVTVLVHGLQHMEPGFKISSFT